MVMWIQKDKKPPPKPYSHSELLDMLMEDEPRKASACKHCGKKGLQWLNYSDGGSPAGVGDKSRWMLLEVLPDGTLVRHKCLAFKN